jgi:uncharacterized membrane protein YoaK (UPF0700 family)
VSPPRPSRNLGEIVRAAQESSVPGIERNSPRRVPARDAAEATHLHSGAGVLLTAVAGYIDAIGFLELGGFFASFMSGASLSAGIEASRAHWSAAADAMLLVSAFVAAATVATIIAEVAAGAGLALVLLLEAVCLAGAVTMSLQGWPPSVCIVPVVAGMGIQNTALRPLDGVRLGVTFMTGTLVSMSQALGGALVGRVRPASFVPHAMVWCAFVAGAGIGALAYMEFRFPALVAPTAVVVGLSALFLWKELRAPAHH